MGALLRRFRKQRGLSQLALATSVEVSSRHLSFVETGRSEPSREMLLRLTRALDLAPRERNEAFVLCGLSIPMRETPLNDPAMFQVRTALDLLLRQMEPFPAVAVDAQWDIVMCNRAMAAFLGVLGGPSLSPHQLLQERPNAMVSLFDPEGIRRCVLNWPQAAAATLDRLLREQARSPRLRPLVREILRYPDVAELVAARDPSATGALVVPLRMALGEHTLELLTTVTTLGTPRDLTLVELHVESFHPLDEATRAFFEHLAVQAPSA